MAPLLTPEEIKTLGFEWPKYDLVAVHCVLADGRVDLERTLEKVRIDQRATQQLIDDAFAFKMNTGADYSDFTDRFDDHVRDRHRLDQAISHLEAILAQATSSGVSSGAKADDGAL